MAFKTVTRQAMAQLLHPAGGVSWGSRGEGACLMSNAELNQRIEAMYRRDVRAAWAFIVVLWLSVGFVAAATWSMAPDTGSRILLLAAGAAVLIFNTASIGAMVKHYAEDKHFIYGLDIRYLDEMRARRG